MLSPTIKKHIIKLFTFFIFPKILRMQIKRHLSYWFGLAQVRPEFFYEHYIYYKTRQKFAEQYQKDLFSYRIISLGCVCFARTVPTLWGIKPRKAQGEVGYPFDLSNSYLDAITKCLTTDFKDYFKDLKFSDQLGMWCTNNEHLQYCHEHDLTKNDRDKIIERFSQRIENLREILKSDKRPAIFINYYRPEYTPKNLSETYSLYNTMYQSLVNYRKDRKFKFMIVDTYGDLDNKTLDPNIELLSFKNIPQPYVWHLDECRCKPFGLAFEQEFIAKVLDILKELQG